MGECSRPRLWVSKDSQARMGAVLGEVNYEALVCQA